MDSPLRVFKAQIFQALAHPTRIAIVEALREGEVSAGALLVQLAVEPANLSQHLAVLRAKHVVVSRKAGNQVYYTLRDPVLIEVLDLLKQYFNAHLQQNAAMLDELHGRPAPAPASQRALMMPWETWRPKLLETLAGYDRRACVADVVAGLTVGVVALPLAMAFGIASGVTPQAGIYTAIVGGFLVSLLGGSSIQIGGPTGAFVVIVAGIIAAHGMSGLLMVTMMAGVILVFLAVTGLGQAVKFIPRPVVIGFTNGIALLIASTQIKDFLGLAIAEPPSEFFAPHDGAGGGTAAMEPGGAGAGGRARWRSCCCARDGCRACRVRSWRWSSARPPWPRSACRLRRSDRSSAAFPSGLPPMAIPPFRADLILPLLPSASTVALLAAVESLLSAVVADSMTGDRHNSSAELMAQGVANLVVAARRRDSGHGRHRPHGHQLPLRRAHAGRGSRACADAAVDRAAAGAAGHLRAAGDAGRRALRRRLQHGRVAGDRPASGGSSGPTSRSG